jgi:hypothetical protein
MNVSRPLSMLALVALMGCATSQSPLTVSKVPAPVKTEAADLKGGYTVINGVRCTSHAVFILHRIASHVDGTINYDENGRPNGGGYDPQVSRDTLNQLVLDADVNGDGIVSVIEAKAHKKRIMNPDRESKPRYVIDQSSYSTEDGYKRDTKFLKDEEDLCELTYDDQVMGINSNSGFAHELCNLDFGGNNFLYSQCLETHDRKAKAALKAAERAFDKCRIHNRAKGRF